MKFTITMKDPDGPYECVQEAAEESLSTIEGIDDDERESLVEARKEKLWESLKPWLEYKEYVTIEIDTEAGTATVVLKAA